MPLLRLRVLGPKGKKEYNAYLDIGASKTLIPETDAHEIGERKSFFDKHKNLLIGVISILILAVVLHLSINSFSPHHGFNEIFPNNPQDFMTRVFFVPNKTTEYKLLPLNASMLVPEVTCSSNVTSGNLTICLLDQENLFKWKNHESFVPIKWVSGGYELKEAIAFLTYGEFYLLVDNKTELNAKIEIRISYIEKADWLGFLVISIIFMVIAVVLILIERYSGG